MLYFFYLTPMPKTAFVFYSILALILLPFLGCGKEAHQKKYEEPITDFHAALAAEAFAHMAAEAIANQEAYRHIVECLPDSYKKFRGMLEKTSRILSLR
jgi:hypothetical protein